MIGNETFTLDVTAQRSSDVVFRSLVVSRYVYLVCMYNYGCCHSQEPGEDMVINVQCGYRRLGQAAGSRMIYEIGCFMKIEQLINQYLYVVAGVGIGLLIFQLVNILLASGLAVDVHREKKALKIHADQEKREKKHDKNLAKI